jgi:hypothetical protein
MQPEQPNWPAQPQPTPDYSFLSESGPPPKRSLFPTGNSLPVKIGLVAGGLLLLIILFAVVKGLLGGGKNYDDFIVITQKQQEIIHLTSSVDEQDNGGNFTLPESMQNFAITAQLGMTSDQAKTLSYLRTNGVKVKAKKLSSGISPSVDSQLQTAASANNYSTTFKQVMHDQLQTYMQSLQQTFAHTSGAHGRELLSQEYDHAKLLSDQLDSSS